jgi:hypothetical protein
MRRSLIPLALLAVTGPALAQSIQQSGTVTPGHAAQWVTSGILKDAGPATAGNLTELGISKNGGLPFCISSDPNPANPRVQLCEGVSLNGNGFISLNSYNGAATVPLDLNINGQIYQFPFVISGIVGPGSAGVGNLACWNNTLGTLLKDCGQSLINQAVYIGPQGTTNPYAGPFPSWLFGIGGIGYYNTSPLATNALYSSTGPISVTNSKPYGDLNTTMAANFAVGADRPGCISGYTAPGQVSTYYENGMAGLCVSADTQPVPWSGPGTFTPTTFTPTAPIPQTGQTFAAVGEWIRSSDIPPFNGQITSWTADGSNNITAITVSGWFQINAGASNPAGTPAGSQAYLNPQDKAWGMIPELFLNSFTTTGNISSGSRTISSIASTAGVYDNGQFLSSNALFPAGTYIAQHTANTITVSQAATGNATGATLTISAGSQMNHGVVAEVDIANNASAFAPLLTTGTATATTGSYTLTSVTNASRLRPGLYVIANSGVPVGTTILSVDVVDGIVTLNAKATGTGSVTYSALPTVDEGGVGFDCAGITLTAQSCYQARGNQAYSFLSYGATNTAFLWRPIGFAAIPFYGFRTDGSIGGHANSYDFAVTNGGANGAADTVLWGVTGAGAELATGGMITGAAGTFRSETFATNQAARISVGIDSSAETGSNAGSNFAVIGFNDAGTFLGSYLTVQRSNGVVTLSNLGGGGNLAVCVNNAGALYTHAPGGC